MDTLPQARGLAIFFLGLWVPVDLSLGPHGDVAQMTDGCRAISDADIRLGDLTYFRAIKEVVDVTEVCLGIDDFLQRDAFQQLFTIRDDAAAID